ncbi:putative low-specificity L-threonine aldolase 1, partial [Ananas comosus]
HCEVRGSEVILGGDSHIHVYENGGISTIGGVHPKTLKNNPDGTMDIDEIVEAIRHPEGELYYPTTRLICLENTHAKFAAVVVEDASLWNTQTSLMWQALGVPVHRLVQAADSVSVCMSKGLGAPVGSVIVGSKLFITKARRLRKTLGGGMRQVGVLCAAAYVALRDNLGKLADDHRRAKIFADGIKQIKHLSVDAATVETNMIFFSITGSTCLSPANLCQVLEEHGVLAMPVSSTSVRLVLHHQISDNDVQYALTCIKQAVQKLLTDGAAK